VPFWGAIVAAEFLSGAAESGAEKVNANAAADVASRKLRI
jgi:hypothetical protein